MRSIRRLVCLIVWVVLRAPLESFFIWLLGKYNALHYNVISTDFVSQQGRPILINLFVRLVLHSYQNPFVFEY